ncbi:hypothetical protein EV1_000446 [Malus domestica]
MVTTAVTTSSNNNRSGGGAVYGHQGYSEVRKRDQEEQIHRHRRSHHRRTIRSILPLPGTLLVLLLFLDFVTKGKTVANEVLVF